MSKSSFFAVLLCLTQTVSAQMPNTISKADKVYGLSRFWQEANYNFIYLDKVDRDMWDNEYKKLIIEVQDTPDDYAYYRLLQQFCALLKDGHTNVYFPDTVQKNLYNTYFGDYRLFMSNIDGKAIVTRVNASKKDEIPIGSEVVAVNGQTTSDYLAEKVIPYISSSTDYILAYRAVQMMFQAPIGTSFDITIKQPDGVRKTLKLTHAETLEKEVYPPFEQSGLLQFKWMDNGIAYLALNSFDDLKIAMQFIEVLPELYKAQKLIVDLRNNGGGNTEIGRAILEFLTYDTLLYGSKQQSRLHIPAFKAWGMWTTEADTAGNAWATQAYLSYRDRFYHQFPYAPDTVRLQEKRLVVPTVLLIGHETASAAEDFLIYADNQKHMFKIGEETYGSTGQPIMFKLPGGGSARICTKKDTYPDGREFVGYGVQPDLVVRKSLADYMNDHDPALEAALNYLKDK
ncbi:MAG: peptidase S41 [Lewinellaceae bacterium]|nr:peptidase S41 [Lewinellaceae bacterium]